MAKGAFPRMNGSCGGGPLLCQFEVVAPCKFDRLASALEGGIV